MKQCVICLEHNTMYLSDCGCIIICKDCINLIDLEDSIFAHGDIDIGLIYCSLNCMYDDFNYDVDIRIFDERLIRNNTYYYRINKHQQYILDQYENKKYYSQLDNYFIPDITKIICDYLVHSNI